MCKFKSVKAELFQISTNNALWVKPSPPLLVMNKILLEHNYTICMLFTAAVPLG